MEIIERALGRESANPRDLNRPREPAVCGNAIERLTSQVLHDSRNTAWIFMFCTTNGRAGYENMIRVAFLRKRR